MIKIIEPAKKEFITVCKNCGCKFSYELEDIQTTWAAHVICPGCEASCIHELKPFDSNKSSVTITDRYDFPCHHDWCATNESMTAGYLYRCVKCGATKVVPF